MRRCASAAGPNAACASSRCTTACVDAGADGIYLATNRSWSIDDRRLNFQFATEMGWQLKGGKVGAFGGAGVVGHWIGPGQRDIPRPTEYIKVARNSIREKESFAEQIREESCTS